MKYDVAIARYQRPEESVAEVIDLSGAFNKLTSGDKVFIKPNIFPCSHHVEIPPWGLITTSRVVEDVIRALKNHNVGSITIGEGLTADNAEGDETPVYTFEALGYNKLPKRYDVKVVNNFKRKRYKKKLKDGMELNFHMDLIDADFVISLPVLRTHDETVVSLSQPNLMDCFHINRQKSYSTNDLGENLDWHKFESSFSELFPKTCAIIDGIYTLERGPGGRNTARRTDILIASEDMLSADIAGSEMLGIYPWDVPYIVSSCKKRRIKPSIDSVEVVGEPINYWAKPHESDSACNGKRMQTPNSILSDCSQKPDNPFSVLKQSGNQMREAIFNNHDMPSYMFMNQYKGKPEFSHDFYRINT